VPARRAPSPALGVTTRYLCVGCGEEWGECSCDSTLYLEHDGSDEDDSVERVLRTLYALIALGVPRDRAQQLAAEAHARGLS
jgi:hypothetical protein